ncbi:carboxypeptidase-like regulatory domain-containing protein [Planctomicrobium sp. SH668]|uniref:carboxypeptidase-like regulatory domain-containing protein n=1 Tax=Planctomicrobium sp. SH668 TaxID=3448126 RepID=UPI003F5BA034
MLNSLAMIIIAGSGCWGTSYPKTYPLKGTVKHRGKALEGATVTLIPTDPQGKSASGITDAEGNFLVKCYMGPNHAPEGVIPGDYKVTVSKFEAVEAPKVEASGADMGPAMMAAHMKMKEPKSLIPIRFNSPVNSGLSVKIESGENPPFAIEITD